MTDMKKVKDHYFHKAKQEGYPARSVYKLKEAQNKYRFLKKGQRVLDLGASPGAWTKYAWQVVGRKGQVFSVDLKPLSARPPSVIFIQQDVFALDLGDLRGFDVVLSDMAPSTTGRRDVDHVRQIGLAERALEIAQTVLLPGGDFFCKVFEGQELLSFRRACEQCFKKVRVFKPKSSRSESVELFLLCSSLISN